jgi:hypothetical protein
LINGKIKTGISQLNIRKYKKGVKEMKKKEIKTHKAPGILSPKNFTPIYCHCSANSIMKILLDDIVVPKNVGVHCLMIDYVETQFDYMHMYNILLYIAQRRIDSMYSQEKGRLEFLVKAIENNLLIEIRDSGPRISRKEATYISSKKYPIRIIRNVLEKIELKFNPESKIKYLINIRDNIEAYGGKIKAIHHLPNKDLVVPSVRIQIPIMQKAD